MGGVPKIVILAVASLCLVLIVIFAIRIKSDRVKKQSLMESEHQQYMSDAMLGLLPTDISRVTKVFVIPGGGPGLQSDGGYPQWTRSRTLAAVEEYRRLQADGGASDVLFFALSAGSLNGANRIGNEDGKIIFECQHVLNHLVSLGIPSDKIFGDFISWDTTANALALRLLVEGLLSTYAHDPETMRKNLKRSDQRRVIIQVFSSDFHTERIKTIFDWVLGLTPSLNKRVDLSIFNIPSVGVGWTSDRDEWNSRMAHEKDAIRENMKLHAAIKTIAEFQAFLLLGGHNGYRNYLFGDYKRSAGAGW